MQAEQEVGVDGDRSTIEEEGADDGVVVVEEEKPQRASGGYL